MALNKKKLESKLKKVMDSSFNNFLDAASAWSNAYVDYAKDAQSCLSAPLIPTNVELARKLLRGTLASSFAITLTPVDWAVNIGTAFSVFWTAPPLLFVSPPTLPGVIVPSPTVTTSFVATMVGYTIKNQVMSLSGSPIKTGPATKSLADVLDKTTKTVVSAHIGTGGCSGPIT